MVRVCSVLWRHCFLGQRAILGRCAWTGSAASIAHISPPSFGISLPKLHGAAIVQIATVVALAPNRATLLSTGRTSARLEPLAARTAAAWPTDLFHLHA